MLDQIFAKNTISQVLEELISEIDQKFPSQLCGVVQFGSTTGKFIKAHTDLDVFFIFDTLPAERASRFAFFDAFELSANKILESLRSEGFDIRLSPLLRTLEEWALYHPLLLDLSYSSKVFLDRNQCVEKTLLAIEKWKQRNGSVRVECGQKWYWILKPGLCPGEAIDFSF